MGREERKRGMGRRVRVRGREGAKAGERGGKGEGGLEFDICPGAPEFLVTPLLLSANSVSCRIVSLLSLLILTSTSALDG